MSNRNRQRILRGIDGPTAQVKEAAGYSKDISFTRFIIEEYGNLNFILDLSDSVIDLGRKFFKRSARYQNTLTVLKYGIPATVFSSQLIAKLKKYRAIKSGKNAVYNEREEKIKKILDVKDNIEIYQESFFLGKDVFFWLFQKPKTESFKILGFYTYDGLNPITDVWGEEKGTMVVPIEYGKTKLVWIVSYSTTFTEEISVKESAIHFDSKATLGYVDVPLTTCLRSAIYKEFLNHFDVKNNVLLLTMIGLHSFKRQTTKEEIRQFDLMRFSNEIRKVLKRKRKRGFAFVGVPGTGKSTIIRKLESLITDYPIIYTTAANYDSRWG